MMVPVVRIGKVPMRVCLRLVRVRMAMPGSGGHRRIMLVLVVFVVDMFMFVPGLFVDMCVFMTLGQVQPCAQRHQGAGGEQPHRGRLSHEQGQCGAEERRDREVCARPRGAEVPQADHEQRQTHPIGQESQ